MNTWFVIFGGFLLLSNTASFMAGRLSCKNKLETLAAQSRRNLKSSSILVVQLLKSQSALASKVDDLENQLKKKR